MSQKIVLNTIEEAIEDIRQGKIIIVVDDEDRENEGDFLAAAEKVTPEMINFMATRTDDPARVRGPQRSIDAHRERACGEDVALHRGLSFQHVVILHSHRKAAISCIAHRRCGVVTSVRVVGLFRQATSLHDVAISRFRETALAAVVSVEGFHSIGFRVTV